MSEQEEYIFALDIGTRSLIGVVLVKEGETYEVLTSKVLYHSSRAMLDGQIHNVGQVADRCRQLISQIEAESGLKIKKVAVAAAGRALETLEITETIDFGRKKQISQDNVNALEFAAIQNARELLLAESERENTDYHFVGYSVREYRLDGMFLTDLYQQRGSKAEADLIVTFLPQIVVDSLLAVISELDLEISGLTLEPIAAARVVIPRDMYNFNLALVDIGAGTADIAVTRAGAMIGYGMVPVAGDEVTEKISENYLIDYHAAEEVKCKLGQNESFTVKNALGMATEIKSEEVYDIIAGQVESLAGMIAEEILKINQQAPRAVICIGGGSLTPGLTEKLAEFLNIEKARVGVRDAEDLRNIKGRISDISSTQTLTPIGIGIVADQNREKTIFTKVTLNKEEIRIFSLQQPLLRDALIAADVDPKTLHGRPGRGITCTINGEITTIPGSFGSPGKVKLNGEAVEIDDKVKNGDIIKFQPGQAGSDARARIKDVVNADQLKEIEIEVNGKAFVITSELKADGKSVNLDTRITDGMDIEFNLNPTIGETGQKFLGLDYTPENDFIEVIVSGEKKYLPQSEWLVTDGNIPLDIEKDIKPGDKLVIKRTEPVQTIKDFIIKDKPQEKIEIALNGSNLELPAVVKTVVVNGEEVAEDYKIAAGDQIDFINEKVTINEALQLIDYQLSDSMKNQAVVKINGQETDFTGELGSGDKLKIMF
ncbi:MAG: cell division protein FtsA [Bacillota bacterium]